MNKTLCMNASCGSTAQHLIDLSRESINIPICNDCIAVYKRAFPAWSNLRLYAYNRSVVTSTTAIVKELRSW